MKRISIWLVLLGMTPAVTQATYYSDPRYRIQYSPYVFSYTHTGLVPGGLDYSPYAVSYCGTGLVPEYVRYTPYAFTYNNSGLIADYAVYPGPCFIPYCGYAGSYSVTRPCAGRMTSYAGAANPPPRRYNSSASSQVAYARSFPPARSRNPKKADGMSIIRQHLQAHGIRNADINRILKVDGGLVSVDFALRDRNLIIKYWNPDEIARLNAAGGVRQMAYEKYRKGWEAFATRYKQAGGEIHYIEASDAQTIVAALESCEKLDMGGNRNGRPTVYAKN